MIVQCFESVVSVSCFNISINTIICQWNMLLANILFVIYCGLNMPSNLGGKLMWTVGKRMVVCYNSKYGN